jgi:hypothetical protein
VFCQANFKDVDELIDLLGDVFGVVLVDLIEALDGDLQVGDGVLLVGLEGEDHFLQLLKCLRHFVSIIMSKQ